MYAAVNFASNNSLASLSYHVFKRDARQKVQFEEAVSIWKAKMTQLTPRVTKLASCHQIS